MHAKRKLTYSRISAAEIAYQLGFKDPAYFSRFFRRYTGKSPVEFRRSPSSFEMSVATVRASRGGFSGKDVEGSSFRSEEHTSELQSLMRISYAFLSLKKKKWI